MSASGWCVRNVDGACFEHVGEAQAVGAPTGAPVEFVALLGAPALGHRRQQLVSRVGTTPCPAITASRLTATPRDTAQTKSCPNEDWEAILKRTGDIWVIEQLLGPDQK